MFNSYREAICHTMTILPVSFALLLLLTGCKKDWLDVSPDTSVNIPSTFSDLQAMMDVSLIVNNYGVAFGEVATPDHYVTETAWSGATTDAKNSYSWSHKYPYNQVVSWNNTYSRILYTNIVIDGLKKLKPSNSIEITTRNNVYGQALFNRSEAYFWLAQIFAPPFSPATAITDMGIPLKITIDITEKTTRSTVQETYTQIIEDLKLAAVLLPDLQTFPTRGSKAAAFGLLARVYLSMQNYQEAFKYADSCLSIKNTLLDYNTLSTTKSFIGTFNSIPANTEILFHTGMYTSSLSSFLTSNCLIDADLFNLYHNDDLRKKIFFRKNTNETISFKGNYFNNTTGLFCGIATDEIHLIRAECFARKGEVTDAMKDLNDLLRKRWSNEIVYIDITATDPQDALRKILEERRKELVMRGIRWHDLRRLNKEEAFKQVLTRSIGGQTYNLSPNSFQYTFPIPDDIIAMSGIKQNLGWL